MLPTVTPSAFFRLFRSAAADWWKDDAFRLAASLAFYTIFSMAPVILICIGIAGMVFGREQATRHLADQVALLIGPRGGTAIEDVVLGLGNSEGGAVAAIVGGLTVMFGSTAVFADLQSSLNHIWRVEPNPRGGLLAGFLRDRVLSFALVLTVGFLLLVSLVASAMIAALSEHLKGRLPEMAWLWQTLDLAISFGFVTFLFMMIYRFLPDAELTWSDVFVGALVTAVLFTVGKYFIGMYLGRATFASYYGAAGSFVVILVWVYYSALISFFGAEFTHVYTLRYGSGLIPEDHAHATDEPS